MSRKEHVLTVFVASPGDVADERTRLEEVIKELNITWSRSLGIRLDLVCWETHTFPGIGDDPQDVINKQIPDDYDIFLGIMWCRYGTKTDRAGSGTVEEFERAKLRYDSDPKSVKLMIYFKDEAITPSRLDPSQLAKVNDFRQTLGNEGVLYCNFTNQEQFEKLVRFHLTCQVQAWKKDLEQHSCTDVTTKPVKKDVNVSEQEISDDDLGLLDLMEICEERFEDLTAISERIATATEELGGKMNQRTVEMGKLPRDLQGNVNRKTVKRCISAVATDMDKFTVCMEVEIPVFSNSLNDGMNALIRAVNIFDDFNTEDTAIEQNNEKLDLIVSFLDVLRTSKESLIEFRETVANLPRMTSDLNRAKRGVVSVLDRLISEFSNGQLLLQESEAVVRDFLRDENND